MTLFLKCLCLASGSGVAIKYIFLKDLEFLGWRFLMNFKVPPPPPQFQKTTNF